MSFRFRPGLSIACALAFAILCSLGAWQLKRLEWKRELIAQMASRLAAEPLPLTEALALAAAGHNIEYQPVVVAGAFDNGNKVGVFGTYDGKPGVNVFTPFNIANAGSIYINRGFAPLSFMDPSVSAASDISGNVNVIGLLRGAEKKRGLEKWLAPNDQPEDRLYFARDPHAFVGASASILDYYIDSAGRENAGEWPKGGLTRTELPNRHLEYALTWFGLAAALVGVFAAYSVNRR